MLKYSTGFFAGKQPARRWAKLREVRSLVSAVGTPTRTPFGTPPAQLQRSMAAGGFLSPTMVEIPRPRTRSRDTYSPFPPILWLQTSVDFRGFGRESPTRPRRCSVLGTERAAGAKLCWKTGQRCRFPGPHPAAEHVSRGLGLDLVLPSG